ncbi:spore cortex-lytic enzyme [Brevibacillus agri]|uniref:spore cortex-lytic enzyme n=1 Tax=Brevibacillus agri TaxID=51101 RepID=UPI0025B6C9F8|nr:spore cortex-lytic enzyme [Brevibacillus agri]MDN4095857.1 spore cortex-lytic enzyme [Brevibacillus agri]
MSWMKKTLTTLLAAMLAVAFVCPAESFAAPLLKRGSESGDVWDLQYRLQLLGYYTDRLDGSYGANTVQAVKKFQKAYGLPVDGVAGTNTWRALKKVSVNRNEMQMLAQLVYSEARGESYTGQVAVAAVALNRLKSKDFPNTLKGVIFEPYAFTAVIDGQYWLSPNKTAYRAAWEAVRGWDPTNGALYYFNPSTATSKWIWSRPQVVKIGKHIFAK